MGEIDCTIKQNQVQNDDGLEHGGSSRSSRVVVLQISTSGISGIKSRQHLLKIGCRMGEVNMCQK